MTNDEFSKQQYERRDVSNYKLDPSKPIILMLDGRSFSSFTKHRFKSPFSERFAFIMDQVAIRLCKDIQNAKFAYTQSDEVSVYIEPCSEETQPWFGARLNKICSIAASMATQTFIDKYLHYPDEDLICNNMFTTTSVPNVQFDCKAWNVDSITEVFEWFRFRNIDCKRNAISMCARSHFSHSMCNGANSEQLKNMLLMKKINFEKDIPMGFQNGRYIRKYYYNKQACNYDMTQFYTVERSMYAALPVIHDIIAYMNPEILNKKLFYEKPKEL